MDARTEDDLLRYGRALANRTGVPLGMVLMNLYLVEGSIVVSPALRRCVRSRATRN